MFDNTNSNLTFLGLVGLMTVSVGSSVLYLHRIEHPDAFPTLPQFTFGHSLSICSIGIAVMLIFIYHSLSILRLLALQIPRIPSSLPYLGHGIRFMQTSPWDLLLNWHKQYGSVICFPLMGRTVVSIASPTYLKLILQSKIRHVKKDVGFSYHPFLVILGKGIVTSEGESWMKQRLKMSTALRKDVLDVIPQITLEAVQRLMNKLDHAAQHQIPVELSEALRHLTLQVISKAFLSLTADESDSTFATMYLPIVDECNTRIWHPWRSACIFMPFWWKHLSHVYRLDSYVSSLIQQRWQERCNMTTTTTTIGTTDMLDIVLDAHEKEFPNKATLTLDAIRQMRDELKTFMLAGHETSAAMMTWAMYEMMGSEQLMKEVRNVSLIFVQTMIVIILGIFYFTNISSTRLLSYIVICSGCYRRRGSVWWTKKYELECQISSRFANPRLIDESRGGGSHVERISPQVFSCPIGCPSLCQSH